LFPFLVCNAIEYSQAKSCICTQFLFKELEVSDGMYWVVTGALDVLGRDGKAITVVISSGILGEPEVTTMLCAKPTVFYQLIDRNLMHRHTLSVSLSILSLTSVFLCYTNLNFPFKFNSWNPAIIVTYSAMCFTILTQLLMLFNNHSIRQEAL
jgi:hypothetical protein